MNWKLKILLWTLASALPIACCCSSAEKEEDGPGTEQPEKPQPPQSQEDVTTYITTSDGIRLFSKGSLKFAKPGSMSPNQLRFEDDAAAKEVDGFGLAVTTASAYNLLKMSQEDRTAILTELFSPTKGAGSGLIRVSIGASDFCLKDEYTWCDTKGLENFAVAKEDKDYLFPVLKEIYAINPDVKIIGSPWSCPKWMKGGSYGYEKFDKKYLERDFPNWTSGRLKPSCYADYATYFVKWIQTMQSGGFKIHAITMQNEPLNHGNSMSMYMPWQDQKEFIKVLGPALKDAGLEKVKILLFDHNYNYDNKDDQRNYPLNIYADAQASKWAAGSAWHSYGGDVSELDNIVTANPEKDIYFTEASIGEWNYNFGSCLLNDFSSIFLGTLKRGGMGVTLWNLMLDDKNAPYSPHNGSCKTCYGAVTINSSDYKTLTRNSHWYNVLHASAVIRPGAKMMKISGFNAPSGVEVLMFKNIDGSIATVVCNKSSEEKTLVYGGEKYTVNFKIPSKCIASAIWMDK